MEELNSKQCNNCQCDIYTTDKFCRECGQKNTNGRVTFWVMVKEFFADQFHLDAKLPRTLFALFFRPGVLTKEYFIGKHKSYIKPIRIFAVAALIFFALIALRLNEQVNNFKMYEVGHDKMMALEMQDSIFQQVGDSLESAKNQINSSATKTLLDSTFAPFMVNLDSLLNDSISIMMMNMGYMKTRSIKIAKKDQYTLSEKELLVKYPPENILEKLVIKQQLHILKDTKGFTRQTIGHISWMFFIMIPFFAILLKLVYIRRKIYYVEHIVFTFHIHAFFFLFFSLNILAETFVSQTVNAIFDLICIIGMMVYIFVAMRRFYEQSFWKTFFKASMLYVGYFMIFMFFFMITILISLAIF